MTEKRAITFDENNCIVWFVYGAFKKERDVPIMIANAPGIIFGLVTAITALL